VIFVWNGELYSSREIKKIKCLIKRANYLEERIENSDKELSYDKQEMAALVWVLHEIDVRVQEE
jgi:hypothetical protein